MIRGNVDIRYYLKSLQKTFKVQRHVSFLLSVVVIYFMWYCANTLTNNKFEGNIASSFASTQEMVVFSNETSYADHMQASLKGCGDICRIDMPGRASLYHDYIEKEVNCKAILSNPAIDAAMGDPEPPASIPTEMINDFTYGGKVELSFYADKLFNERYLGKKVLQTHNFHEI